MTTKLKFWKIENGKIWDAWNDVELGRFCATLILDNSKGLTKTVRRKHEILSSKIKPLKADWIFYMKIRTKNNVSISPQNSGVLY